MSWTPDKEARHQESRAEAAEARVAQLEDILARASRLAESEHAGMVQQVIQEAWGKLANASQTNPENSIPQGN